MNSTTFASFRAFIFSRCDWSIYVIQVERKRTHLNFQKLYQTGLTLNDLYDTTCMIQLV